MKTLTGLDILVGEDFRSIRGRSIAVVCHQASIDGANVHILDRLLPLHQSGEVKIRAAFGPQHGIWGHTQDNMIEWEGYEDARTGLRFFSLYGEHREPTPAMLDGVEELIIDVQDVGARYYTFIWTLANCMKACESLGIRVTVLDRPNPVNGVTVEGPGFDPAFRSFVGLYPLPVRHALSIGEVARYLQRAFFPKTDVRVVDMVGWDRRSDFSATGLSWPLPSPNMPTVDTALVYPGMCLLEGTSLSEGRGTTRPFEMFGAPGIEPWHLAEQFNALGLPGVHLRPVFFEPTFQKHAQSICGGGFIHVTDKAAFRPVLTAVMLLRTIRASFSEALHWNPPPYEYEYEKLPIDILAGGPWIREAIDNQISLDKVRERIDVEGQELADKVAGYLSD